MSDGMGEGPLATLPMYDWPEVRAETDALWAGLRDGLRARGVAVPDALSRDALHWTNPRLVLSQTCALPFRQGLSAHVTLVGAPDYGLDGCPPGFYRSALVVRADDPREAPSELAAARFAYNGTDSQSGWGALREALGPLDPDEGLAAGAHREAIRAIAAGRADVAAIDAQCWRLAQAWEPAAARLRVVAWTRPTPGPPLIAGGRRDPAPFAAAAAEAIAVLAPAARAALGLVGFVARTPEFYVSGSAPA